MASKIWLFVGPSGAGKTTLVRRLADEGLLREVVSVTSRTPRDGEVAAATYKFVSQEEFLHLRDSGQLAEYVVFAGNYYGILSGSIDEALAQGHVGIIVEPMGAIQISDMYRGRVERIYIEAPHYEELMRRMEQRFAKEAKAQFEARRDSDRQIMQYRTYCEHTLLPDSLENWVKQVRKIIEGSK